MAVETGWHQRERGATERIGLAYPYGRELVHAPIPGNNTELAYDPASGIYLPRTLSGPRSLSNYSPDVTKQWLNTAGGSYSIFANRRVFTAGTGTRTFFASKATYSSSGIYHYLTSGGVYTFEHWNGTVSAVTTALGANDNDEFLITYNGTTLSFVLWSGGGTRYTHSAAINSYGASGAWTGINSADGGQSIGSDYFFVWNRVVTESEIEPLRNNPKAAYRFSPKTVFKFPSAGGGGATITGSGTPTAQASTVSGTAERSVTGSGTPTAQASTVAGVAERVITSSGALASQSSAVAGSGSVGNAISGSGTLLAQSSQVAGTAERSVTGSGTPASQSATVSGAAERIVTGTGTPTSQSSTVSGTGQVGNVVTGSGSPTAQSATVSGTAERTVTSSGALSAQSSTVAGTAERTITGSGALSAQSSTVYGFDSAPVVPDTGGGGSRTVAFSSRKLRQELEEWEQKNQEKERLKRLMREDEELVLIMLALAA